MKTTPDLSAYPLCAFFLSGYLSHRADDVNFPPDHLAKVYEAYESLFANALAVLGMTKEQLKARSEFKFHSGDANNFEGGISMLRAVLALKEHGFTEITFINVQAGSNGADILCVKKGHRVCCEVKTITKQSNPRKGFYLADQLYEGIRTHASKAVAQLDASKAEHSCSVRVLICVVNWSSPLIYLTDADFQGVLDKLEMNEEEQILSGIEGVMIISINGGARLFLSEDGKRMID